MPRAALVVLTLLACTETEPTKAPTGPTRADVTLSEVTLRQYRGGTLKVSAQAPRLELMRGSSDFAAFDASVEIERSGVEILSRTVHGNATAQTATGSDGVRFLGNDGTVAVTDSASYDRAIGTEGGANGDAGVAIDHPRFHLDSDGFSADFAQQQVSFDRPRTTTKTP